MKKNILSNFLQVEKYGSRRHVVRFYEVSGYYFVTWKFTSMSKSQTISFGNDASSAQLNYIQKVLFLLS